MSHQVSVDPVDDVSAQSLQWLYKYRFLRMQAVWGQSLLPKKTAQVVLHNSSFFAALLKEEASNGGLQLAVLIPLRMLIDERSHGTVQIFRKLIFHTYVTRHRIRRLFQLVPSLSTQPSAHTAQRDVKKPKRLRLSQGFAKNPGSHWDSCLRVCL